jgi:hypothetical protein
MRLGFLRRWRDNPRALEPFARRTAGASGGPRDRGDEFISALEAASRGIQNPVAKLRFIRGSLGRYQVLDRCVRAVPVPSLRRHLYHWLSLEGMNHLLTRNPYGAAARLPLRASLRLYASRSAAAALVLLAVGSLATAAYRLTRPLPVIPVHADARPAPVAESLPTLPASVTPATIWLVERGASWEQYSNGLRIDTSLTVSGDARRYRVFDAKDGLQPDLRQRPVGILFHTSESDIWPFEATFNENLRDSSQHLLKYLQRNRTYHYLIDRFGRVFRVVDEESKANHAGNSVWQKDATVYLNLNNAFLAVAFESRWGGGQAMPITQAQLAAGRNLTDYLRQRWDIPAEMCVAHGLASVNPKKHLIGHHMDWSRGFPWAAFGLPDQYARVDPSVALFGFGYDDDLLKVLGEPWDGVRAAEERLREEARTRGVSVEGVRRERQALYDRWSAEQAQAERKTGSMVATASGG